MKTLGRFSIGVGDRFARQAKAQLEACLLASQQGIEVIPVWNKSNREHTIIGSDPSITRAAADAAVQALHWNKPYYCDADHINLSAVDRFLTPCDYRMRRSSISTRNGCPTPARSRNGSRINSLPRCDTILKTRHTIPAFASCFTLVLKSLRRWAADILICLRRTST
jgi:hypothetical protein